LLWHNPLTGLGRGFACFARDDEFAVAAAAYAAAQAAAAAGAAGATGASS
jgi:hypothetical protein